MLETSPAVTAHRETPPPPGHAPTAHNGLHTLLSGQIPTSGRIPLSVHGPSSGRIPMSGGGGLLSGNQGAGIRSGNLDGAEKMPLTTFEALAIAAAMKTDGCSRASRDTSFVGSDFAVDGASVAAGGSVISSPEGYSRQLSAIRLDLNQVQPERRRWHEFYTKHLKSFFLRNRLGLQYTLTILLSSPFLYIESVSTRLGGSSSLLVSSALAVADSTSGAQGRRAVNRMIGLGVGYLIAVVLLCPLQILRYSTLSEHWWMRWVMYGNAIVITIFWSFIRYHYPFSPTLFLGGLSGSLSLYSITLNNWWEGMLLVTAANFAGVIIGTLVFQLVTPRTARSLLMNDTSQLLAKMASSLRPLIEYESGLVRNQSFFAPKGPRASIADVFRRKGSVRSDGGAAPRSDATFLERKKWGFGLGRKESKAIVDDGEIDFQVLKEFRDGMWALIDETSSMLQQQGSMATFANREYTLFARPHKFPTTEYMALLDSLRAVFFHVTSVYLVLDTQSHVLTGAASDVAEVLGPQWQLAGTFRVRSPEIPQATSDFASAIKRLRTDNIGRVMRTDTSDTVGIRRGFLSNPALRGFAEDMASTPFDRGLRPPTYLSTLPLGNNDSDVDSRRTSLEMDSAHQIPPNTVRIHLPSFAAQTPPATTRTLETNVSPPSTSGLYRAQTMNEVARAAQGTQTAQGTYTAQGTQTAGRSTEEMANEEGLPPRRGPTRLDSRYGEETGPEFVGPDRMGSENSQSPRKSPDATKSPDAPMKKGIQFLLPADQPRSSVRSEGGKRLTGIEVCTVLQWAQIYGPIIRGAAHAISATLASMSHAVETGHLTADCWKHFESAELSILELVEQREQWQETVQEVFENFILFARGSSRSSPSRGISPAQQIFPTQGISPTHDISPSHQMSPAQGMSPAQSMSPAQGRSAVQGAPPQQKAPPGQGPSSPIGGSPTGKSPRRGTSIRMNEETRLHWDENHLRKHLDQSLLKQWMGLDTSTYLDATHEEKKSLWEAFGNISDRLATTMATILALVLQLESAIFALKSFMIALNLQVDSPPSKIH